jgi:hypothetical protein
MYRKGMGQMEVNWIHLAQDREKCFCENGNELPSSIQIGQFFEQLRNY